MTFSTDKKALQSNISINTTTDICPTKSTSSLHHTLAVSTSSFHSQSHCHSYGSSYGHGNGHGSSQSQQQRGRGKTFEKLPLKKTLSAHLPRVVAIGGGATGTAAGGRHLVNLYGDWSHDSVTELQVDPAIYDFDYDDVSDAGSDFTEDYSRHRVSIGDAGGVCNKDDYYYDDDESSLSSAGSFGEEDDWSAASSNASSAADSRVLHRKVQSSYTGDTSPQGTPLVNTSSYEDHLLDDPTEISVEEDPLLDMSGALKLFDEPASKHPIPMNEVEFDTWSDEDPNESLAPSEPSRIWKETPDGSFVPQSEKWSINDQKATRIPPPPPQPLKSFLSQPSIHSEESAYSVDSFAGERTPPSKRKTFSNETGQGRTRRNKRDEARTPPPRPASPLQPDAKLKVDTSDEEDETDFAPPVALSTLDEVLVFSDDEKDKSTIQAPKPLLREKSLQVRRSGSPNPIVPTPLSILSQSLPARHWENMSVNDSMQYSVDFTRIRISPSEHRAPLKDHSKRPRKTNKKHKDAKKSKKKSSNLSSKLKGSSRSLGASKSAIVGTSETDAESMAESASSTQHEEYYDDAVSLVSKDSLDSMDATGVSKRTRSKMTQVLEQKARKAEKKKRKKEKVRKRGRRADFEEDSVHDETLKQNTGAVADRVEAIFTNIQMIYDTTLNKEQDRATAKSESFNHSTQSKEMEVDTKSFVVSKPEKIKVRSKAAEALLDQAKEEKRSNDKIESRSRDKSRSKSRSRSVSKDPLKQHRSRSKSKDAVLRTDSRSRSKSRHRSESVDQTKTESTSRRRLKKDAPTDTIVQESTLPIKESRSKVSTKKEKSPDKPSRRSKSPKQRTPRSATPSLENTMRLQDIIDVDESWNCSSAHPNPSNSIPCLSEAPDFELCDSKGKVEFLQRRETEIVQSTKDEILEMKDNLEKQKVELKAKVMAEKERKNALEAILFLHKIKAKDYHESGRILKKELKTLERDMSREISRCFEMTLKSQEWQMKTMNIIGKIQQLEHDNVRQRLEFENCQREFRMLDELSREKESNLFTQIGGFSDYTLDAKTPLYRRWREPKQPKIDDKVLMDSYKLPRSSIFYNVLDDDEYKLTFKSP